MKLYWNILKISLSQIFSLRFSFVFYTLESLSYYFVIIFFFDVLFFRFHHLNYWTHEQVNILISAFFLINGIYSFIFKINVSKLPQIINDGRFDFVLINPMPTLLYYSVRRVFVPSLGEVFIGIFLLIKSLYQYPDPLDLISIFLFGVFLINSIFLLLGIHLLFVIPAFWTHSRTALEPVYDAVKDIARYPDNLFPSSWRLVFVFILPISLIASIPTSFLIKKEGYEYAFVLILVGTAILWWTISMLWKKGLKSYSSASS